MASRTSVRGLGRVVAGAALLFGMAMICSTFSRTMWLSAVLLTGAGFGMMIQMASCNTLLQTIVDDDKRGRVMSFYPMAFMGMGPFGSLLAGVLSARFGAPVAVIIGGAGCILAAAVFASRLPKLGRLVHPIYVRMGIADEQQQDMGL